MNRLIARTVYGGKDLYHGIPNLNNAVVKEVQYRTTSDDYITVIVLKRPDDTEIEIEIRQEK